MPFALYYINPRTLSIDIKSFYQNYEVATKHLKSETEYLMKNNKNIEKIEYINKKVEIQKKIDGYYLKISNKYPNRINVYEKSSKDIGVIFSNIIVEIKKIYVFSLLELTFNNSNEQNVSMSIIQSLEQEKNHNVRSSKKTNTNRPTIEFIYLAELKDKIQKRYVL